MIVNTKMKPLSIDTGPSIKSNKNPIGLFDIFQIYQNERWMFSFKK